MSTAVMDSAVSARSCSATGVPCMSSPSRVTSAGSTGRSAPADDTSGSAKCVSASHACARLRGGCDASMACSSAGSSVGALSSGKRRGSLTEPRSCASWPTQCTTWYSTRGCGSDAMRPSSAISAGTCRPISWPQCSPSRESARTPAQRRCHEAASPVYSVTRGRAMGSMLAPVRALDSRSTAAAPTLAMSPSSSGSSSSILCAQCSSSSTSASKPKASVTALRASTGCLRNMAPAWEATDTRNSTAVWRTVVSSEVVRATSSMASPMGCRCGRSTVGCRSATSTSASIASFAASSFMLFSALSITRSMGGTSGCSARRCSLLSCASSRDVAATRAATRTSIASLPVSRAAYVSARRGVCGTTSSLQYSETRSNTLSADSRSPASELCSMVMHAGMSSFQGELKSNSARASWAMT
mmetsp:Transcript_20966/g.67543  ORF Transcript_20966/g.67543 Transcript_20966/m.67543 type:complete len:415 (-) Transcript_20966:308-1552(-)